MNKEEDVLNFDTKPLKTEIEPVESRSSKIFQRKMAILQPFRREKTESASPNHTRLSHLFNPSSNDQNKDRPRSRESIKPNNGVPQGSMEKLPESPYCNTSIRKTSFYLK